MKAGGLVSVRWKDTLEYRSGCLAGWGEYRTRDGGDLEDGEFGVQCQPVLISGYAKRGFTSEEGIIQESWRNHSRMYLGLVKAAAPSNRSKKQLCSCIK